MKTRSKLLSFAMTFVLMSCSFSTVMPVSAEYETDGDNLECVGTLAENFDGLADASALYRQSGEGVLSGTWQRSSRGANGSAEVGSGAVNITAPNGASSWDTYSGVDFVFDKPLAPNYIIEVSYEMSGDGYGSVFFNNLSDADAEMSNVNSIGAGYWDSGFQLLTANEDKSAAFGSWTNRTGNASVTAVYNLKNWTYDGTVIIGTEMGQVMARSIGPAAYNDFGGTFVCTPDSKFNRLTFAVRQGTSKFDNISIKAYKIKQMAESDINIDFSDFSTIEDMRKAGFLISNEEKVSVGSAYEGDSMSPSMCINTSYNGVNIPAFNEVKYDGAYLVSYWIYNANSNAHMFVDAPMVMNGWDDGSLMLLQVKDNAASIGASVSSSGSTVAQLKDNEWYRFENIINLDARTVSAQAYDASGNKIGNFVQHEFANMTDGLSASLINHFGGIRIRNWSDMDMFMDNIQIKKYFVAPSLTKYGISFIMADGTENYEKENINPAVEGIMINFGTKITEESAETGIHLSTKDGANVDFDIEENRGKYFLKLDKLLEPNQSYTLTADKEIANEAGTTMAQTFQYTFTTGNGEFLAKAVSIKANGSVLEDMTGVPGTDTLKVNIQYVNPLLKAQNIECIISYYDNNNRTIGKTIHEIEALESSAGKVELASKKVPENCSYIEVVLWSDLETMIPYCDTLRISE